MLDSMRKHSQSFLIYVIFGAIIVVFAVNFGPGGGTCGGTTGDFAAKVNGDIIRRQDFAMIYDQQLDYMRRSASLSGGQFNAETAEQLGLKKRVIDQLINQKLLAQQARARGMSVSDAELLEFLEQRFRVDEVDSETYKAWVHRNFEQSVQRFEAEMRNEILAERIERVVRDTISISDEELKRQYEREHDRAMVTFAKIDTETYAGKAAAPTAAAIDELLAGDMKAVEERYERDMFKYRTPQQVRVRHILKKLPTGASEADVARARGELLELKAQIQGGADFASLAKAHSEDEATQHSGGDLGFVKRGQVAKAMVDAVIDLKKDQLAADPVRTPQGLHLLQVTEVKPAERQELEAVKRDVATEVLKERAADAAAKAAADQLLGQLRSGKKLEDLTLTQDQERELEDKKQPVNKPVRAETPWILKSQEGLPRIGSSPELHREIFALTKEQPLASQPHKVSRSWYVVILKDRETPDLSKFESEKATLEKQQVQVRGSEVYDAWIEHLRKTSNIVLNPELFPPEEEGRALPFKLPS